MCIRDRRLNWFKMYDASKDKKRKKKEDKKQMKEENQKENKEETTMEKTMKNEGMMCEHCEARVKKCLEAVSYTHKWIIWGCCPM